MNVNPVKVICCSALASPDRPQIAQRFADAYRHGYRLHSTVSDAQGIVWTLVHQDYLGGRRRGPVRFSSVFEAVVLVLFCWAELREYRSRQQSYLRAEAEFWRETATAERELRQEIEQNYNAVVNAVYAQRDGDDGEEEE